MNPALFFLLILPLFIVLMQQKREENWMAQYLKLKYRKENHLMKEAAEKFIDRKCQIYLLGGEVEGIIREVTDHTLLIETSLDRQVLNLDFVIRIREPRKKKNQ